MIRVFILTTLAAVALQPASALACATCACGSPTLTASGAEQPFAGRLRTSSTLRAWGARLGVPGVNEQRLEEVRMDLGIAYAPTPWLFVTTAIPLQARQLEEVSLARQSSFGMGDVEVSARAYVFRDRAFQPRHMVSVIGGLKLPTAPLQRGAGARRPLSIDAQLGSGSVDPLAGLAYGGFWRDWSLFASAVGTVPGRGWDAYRLGSSVRSSVALQYQSRWPVAFRFGADSRWDGVANQAGVQDSIGTGWTAFASPDLLFSPTQDVVLQLGARIPVWQRLSGPARQLPVVIAGIAYDL